MGLYNEQDIKAILNRAIQLQQRSSGAESISESSEKLSLEEIEEIAKDAGVYPDFVREAALEYEGIPVEKPLFIDTGDRSKIELLGYAKGKLDKRTWAELRSIIEYHFDSPGKVKKHLHSIIWRAQPQGILKYLHSRKSPVVEISSSANKSTIKIKKSLKTHNKLLWPAYAALGGAAMLLAVAMMEAPEALVFSAVLLVVAKGFHYWAKNKIKKVREQLIDTMEQLQTIITRRFSASEKVDSKEMQKPVLNIPEEEKNTDRDFELNNPRNREKN